MIWRIWKSNHRSGIENSGYLTLLKVTIALVISVGLCFIVTINIQAKKDNYRIINKQSYC